MLVVDSGVWIDFFNGAPSPAGATLRRLLGAAALQTRPLRDAAEAIPALHAAIGGWRN